MQGDLQVSGRHSVVEDGLVYTCGAGVVGCKGKEKEIGG